MARKKQQEASPVRAFSMTLEEYLRRKPTAATETTKGFQVALMGTGLATGRKMAAEWDILYQLFLEKPVGVSMKNWTAKKRR